MTKEQYNSSWYNGSDFIIVEIPFAEDANDFQKLLQDKNIYYDYRINPDNGKNVYILFKDKKPDNGEELHNILEHGIGMTENEIDYFSGNFTESDFDETDVKVEI